MLRLVVQGWSVGWLNWEVFEAEEEGTHRWVYLVLRDKAHARSELWRKSRERLFLLHGIAWLTKRVCSAGSSSLVDILRRHDGHGLLVVVPFGVDALFTRFASSIEKQTNTSLLLSPKGYPAFLFLASDNAVSR